jgi:hypothetical protein
VDDVPCDHDPAGEMTDKGIRPTREICAGSAG